MIKNNMVNIGNRTLCCPVQSVIIWVINKIRLLLRNRSILLIARMITDRIGPLSVILSSWIPFKQVISACRVNSIYSYPRIGSHDHTIQFNYSRGKSNFDQNSNRCSVSWSWWRQMPLVCSWIKRYIDRNTWFHNCSSCLMLNCKQLTLYPHLTFSSTYSANISVTYKNTLTQ